MTPSEREAIARPSQEELNDLFGVYVRTRQRSVRNQLVTAYQGFAVHMASRYYGRGLADDDLKQIAFLALIKSVDRFDPEYGVAFTTFAGRTIEGEIKRHFRDVAWSMRVPRSTKELHLAVRRAHDELSQELNRSPLVPEVARHLGVSADEVVEAMAAAAAYAPSSLDAPGEDDNGQERSPAIARDETGFAGTDDRMLVEELVKRLPDREREIVRLRFFDQLTQTEIAERMGISQMHVSRLLRRALTMMRDASGLDRRT